MKILIEIFNDDLKMLIPVQLREINDILKKIHNCNSYEKRSGKLKFSNLYGSKGAFILDDN